MLNKFPENKESEKENKTQKKANNKQILQYY